MNILLTNDDGFNAVGIKTLYSFLQNNLSNTNIKVIAPKTDQSCCSSSLTLKRPIYLVQEEENFFSVDGLSCDCVYLAANGVANSIGLDPVDFMIAGINEGANLGDDTLYSGTVGAAIEGRFFGSISIAISLCGSTHFLTAAKVALEVLELLPSLRESLANYLPLVLNVNVPDIAYDKINGVAVTKLGSRYRNHELVPLKDPKGRDCYWIGVQGLGENEKDTDFEAIAQNKVSISPISHDRTAHNLLDVLANII